MLGSKIGIELAAMGLKVIVVGDCWTREKNISVDPRSIEEYEHILMYCENRKFTFMPDKKER